MSKKDEIIVELRREVASLKKQLAEERELSERWRLKYLAANEKLTRAEHKIELLEKKIASQAEEIEKLKAHVSWLQKQLFGNKADSSMPALLPSEFEQSLAKPKLKRGKQPGTKGYSRFSRTDIAPSLNLCELSRDEQRCKQCGRLYRMMMTSKKSEEIDINISLVRYIHERCQYKKACSCLEEPPILIAPAPPKVIPKGLFGKNFWKEVLLEKFLLQRPIERVLKNLELHGLYVSDGTISGGLKYFSEVRFFDALDEGVKDRNRSSPMWHSDDTGWKVFEDIDGKKNHNWFLWGYFTEDTSVYHIDSSRAAEVSERYFKDIQTGTLVCDRYTGYQPLTKKFDLAYCWAHVRRDFIKIRDGYPTVAPKAQSWIERIDDLFELNKLRCQYLSNKKQFAKLDKKLRVAIKNMRRAANAHLRDPSGHPKLKLALTSLKKHWQGLTIFVDRPEVPMDNNKAERGLRNLVVGRKNYYGSKSKWMADFSAKVTTVLTTIDQNGLDVRKWLGDYLQACAENGGKPPDNATDWLPWNMTPERRAYYAKTTYKQPLTK